MSELNILQQYNIDESNWNDVWDELKKECPNLQNWGAEILSSGLAGSIKSILLEPFYTCKDHRNLYSNFYSKKFIASSRYTARLHFFTEPIVNAANLITNPDNYTNSYVGYSVIRPVQQRCLGRTVIDPFKLERINGSSHFCLTTDFNTHIAGQHFKVTGYPYMSQDADVTVCAHTALWGVCRYLSERYTHYPEIYPFHLVSLTEHSAGRTFPYRKMTYSDYSKILTEFGTYPVIVRLKNSISDPRPKEDEFRNLCTYVESGFPILASFHGHVITLIGHTLDYNRNVVVDSYGFVDNSAFFKHFVVIDDNCFPYQLLGYDGDPDNYAGRYPYSINSIVTAVCPLPEKAFLPAERARAKALQHFRDLKTQLESTGTGPFVTRLFLTTNPAFKRRKLQQAEKNETFDRLCYYVSQFRLPHFIWVMEVSPIDKYKQGLCTAEIVMDSTASFLEESTIYFRMGNTLVFGGKEHTYEDTPQVFGQYTHNLGEGD